MNRPRNPKDQNTLGPSFSTANPGAPADQRKRVSARKRASAAYSIRFTSEERARLDLEAGPDGLAAYIRAKLFDGEVSPRKVTPPKPSADRERLGRVLGALAQSRIASNLNQLARAANTGALPVSPEIENELRGACADVALMRAELLRALGVRDPANKGQRRGAAPS
ncbi:MAG: plasmid mobilization relaxosome protein MobC [Pseudomonadota bacterium]